MNAFGWLAGTPFEVIPGATVAGLLAGATLPILGMFVVLQRVVFLGITLAQVAAAGVALGMFLHLPALASGFAVTLVVVALFTHGQRGGIGKTGDASLGAVFCVASALALLFVSRSAVELDQVHHVLHGNLVFANLADVRLVALTSLAALAVLAVTFRPILFCAFDPETASALGLKTRGWMLLLFGMLAVVLTVSMRTTGSLLSFALMVLPPLAALQLRVGLRSTFAWASVLGLLGTAAGLLLAVRADLHVESSITVTLFAMLPVTAAWHRHRGLGLALAVALLAAGVALGQHDVEHADVSPAGGHASIAPYDVKVHLHEARQTGDELTLKWSLDIHTDAHESPLPPAIWLILTAGDSNTEIALVEDTATLDRPVDHIEGNLTIPATGTVDRVDGQLWSGPLVSMDAEPLAYAEVLGAVVRH